MHIEKQAAVGQLFSLLKDVVHKVRPRKLSFVGAGSQQKTIEEMRPAESFSLNDPAAEKGFGDREPAKRFNFWSLLHLRTFPYLIAVTIFFVFYINNILRINALSRENERLRESIGTSKSINAALELRLGELHMIHKISGRAEKMGLEARMTPAVRIGAE